MSITSVKSAITRNSLNLNLIVKISQTHKMQKIDGIEKNRKIK